MEKFDQLLLFVTSCDDCYQQLNLSIKDREIFFKALLNTPMPSSKLLTAVKKYKKNVVSR